MSKWISTSLGEQCDMRRGASPRPINNPDFFSDEGRGWIRISDLANANKYLLETSQYLSKYGEQFSVPVEPGDLIVSICATIGKPILLGLKACIHDGFVFLYNTGNNDREYLYYLLQYKQESISGLAQTGTQGNLNTNLLREFKVFISQNLAEQAKIAEILTTVDTAIDKTKAHIVKYKNIKEGLLQDLLTNGIDENGIIRSPETHKYKFSLLGMIPVEWDCVELNKLCKVYSGSTPKTADESNWNGTITWITPNDLSKISTQYIDNSERKISKKGLSESTGRMLHENSIILSCRAPVGYCAIVKCNYSFNQGCKALVPYSNVNTEYIYYYLSTQKSMLEKVSSGTTFLELPKKELQRFLIAIPKTYNEQSIIAHNFIKIDNKIANEQAYLDKLQSIKKGLMQDLLTNTISVDRLL